MTFLLTLPRLLSPRGWLYAGLALLAVILLSVTYCTVPRPHREAAKKAEASATLADGRTRAAQDASQIRDGHEARTDQTRQDVKEAQDAVRSETDPAARDRVARQRLCHLNPGACPR